MTAVIACIMDPHGTCHIIFGILLPERGGGLFEPNDPHPPLTGLSFLCTYTGEPGDEVTAHSVQNTMAVEESIIIEDLLRQEISLC